MSELGEYRVSADTLEVYVLVDGTPHWRAAKWEWINTEPFLRWICTPILDENEVLRETEMGPVEIITRPYSRLT